MDKTRTDLLKTIIDVIDKTYFEFLTAQDLTDTAVAKVGFFTALTKVVDEDPIPDVGLQQEVLRYLLHTKQIAMDDYLEQAEMLFIQATKAQQLVA